MKTSLLLLIQEIIFPRHCAVCNNIIDSGYFCQRCRQNFVLKKRIVPEEDIKEVFLLYKYQQQLQTALQKIKFTGKKEFLSMLSEEAELALPKNRKYFFQQYDLITNIPTSKDRLTKRGFDIPREIFRNLCNGRWQDGVIDRTRKTASLFALTPDLRKEELSGCFAIKTDVQRKRVLLCDDIYTTGSTVKEAAKVLIHSGAASVSVLTFCASKDNW